MGEGKPRVNLYRFIDAHRAEYLLRQLCSALAVAPSAYHYWNSTGRAADEQRSLEDAEFTRVVRRVHADSDGTYGADRVHAQLLRDGWYSSVNTVARAMAKAGLRGISGRERSTTTTRRDRLAAPFPDLVNRQFLPSEPNTLWYGDITYIWVGDKFWYLATVLDAGMKEVLGWALADHMRVELVATALHRAVARRGKIPAGLVFHSDYAELCVKPRDRVLACVGGGSLTDYSA